jgi:outer membrane lipoprotein SlyB
MIRTALFVGGGALAGFLYAHFVGCRTGSCPLTSNPYTATVYGAVIGLLLGQS